MILTLHSTSKIVKLSPPGGSVGEVSARVWEGETSSGVKVHAFIALVAVKNDQDQSEFERDLMKHAAPSPDVAAIPLRLVL